MRTLWPPAAATSSALLACSWPRMSAMSTPPDTPSPASSPSPAGPVVLDTGSICSAPRRWVTSSARLDTGTISTPSTSAASPESSEGTNTLSNPSSLATTTIGRTPLVCLRVPSRDSSPRNREESGTDATWREFKRSATAIGKSYAGPAFLRSAGARLTVIRRIGNSQPELRTAARTRSRASWTAVSGRPTIVKEGSPGEISTSTSTMNPSRPTTADVCDLASTWRTPTSTDPGHPIGVGVTAV